MTRYLDIRIGSSGRLDHIRRIECFALLLMAAVMAYAYQPAGFLLAFPALPVALMLVPGRATAPSRASQRKDVLKELQNEGLSLRARWRMAVESPLTDDNAAERWFVQRNAAVWMTACSERLRRFPEVGGIFDAHERGEGAIEELDACIATLSRLQRLLGMSERLDLPI